jgi:UDP-3-O-[3-hydroxymyristoyl] glucosamine N-acyltransferase
MEFTARQIASFLGGEVIGDLDVKVNNVSKIEEGKPGTLSFLSNPKYEPYLYETQSSIVLVNRSFKPERPVQATLIKVQDAYQALALLMDMYVQSKPVKKGIEIPSYVSTTSKIGESVYIGAFTYIGDDVVIGKNVQIHPQCWIGRGSKIGDNTIIYAGAKIYPDTQIGQACIVHSGAVIGADGFGFAPQADGTYKKLHQIGNVILEDHVEIGANTTIDCATMGSTIVRKGAKIDNLVQIAHNVDVGENTVMAAQTGIAGSTIIGKNCQFGGQVGIIGHLNIGENVRIGAQSGISNNIPAGHIVMGSPAIDISKYKRVNAVFRNLPDLFTEVHQIKKEIKNLKAE